MPNRKTSLIAWSVAAACAGYAGGVAAAGFQLSEQNASGLGNAFAGQAASAQDASTIFFNPAGMTQLPGGNVVGAINAIRPSIKFTNSASTLAPLQPSAGGNGGDAGDWAFVPNGYFSYQVTPQVFVGVGVTAPFGLKTEYDPTWIGRFHAIESEIKTINVNPSIALKLSDTISIGAGVNWQRVEATLTNAVNYSAAAGGLLGAGLQGIAKVEGDDSAWGYNFGVLINLDPNARIGISYRSAMSYKISGSAAFDSRPAALAAAIPDGPITADLKVPATASIGYFRRLNAQWDVLADVSWTGWSSLQTLTIVRAGGARLATIPLNWKDTYRFGLGLNYHYNGPWTARVGVAYDQSPSSDADRTPRVPDENRTWLALGGQYRMSKQAAIDVGYAHLFIKDGSSNLCSPAQAAANPAACGGKNNLVGTYKSDVNIISAQLRYAF